MSTTTTKTALPARLDGRLLARVTEEGYGPGAWHGPDLKAALADVSAEAAFWRPAPGRHNIADIALHHAYCVRSARGRLSGTEPEPFVLPGDDWFDAAASGLGWPRIQHVVEDEHGRLAALLASLAAGSARSPLAEGERFELALGLTCHAVYHAGQVQLLKRLRGD